MKTVAIILLGLLVAWWLVLTIFLTLNHRKRGREARIPLTKEEREECRQLEASLPRYHMRPIHWVFISPLVLVMLPLYLYGWLVTDPYARQFKA
jgi:hypothetical protein